MVTNRVRPTSKCGSVPDCTACLISSPFHTFNRARILLCLFVLRDCIAANGKASHICQLDHLVCLSCQRRAFIYDTVYWAVCHLRYVLIVD